MPESRRLDLRSPRRSPASSPPLRRAAAALGLAAVFLALAVQNSRAQDRPPPLPSGPLRIVERSDFSRYVDGKYVGHAYREARAALAVEGPAGGTASGTAGGTRYSGSVYILEESLHDLRAQTRQLDQALPVRLAILGDGSFRFDEDPGIPSIRGLPAIPDGPVAPGRSWTLAGDRALDFDASGAVVHLPFVAECRLVGEKLYAGRRALEIAARFATRYSAAARPSTAPPEPSSAATTRGISSATGTHELDILVDADSRWPLLIRDRFDETFALAGGGTERRAGFTLVFFEGALPLDRAVAEAAIRGGIASAENAGGSGATGSRPADGAPSGTVSGPAPAAGSGAAPGGPAASTAQPQPSTEGDRALDAAGVELSQSKNGIVLRIRDLHFVADSEEVLPSDLWRLDAIAAALKALPGRTFLVEGHSAATGNPSGELELSQRRAKRVADELAARGIEAGRFLYKGYGSSRPIAPNDSDADRARNRRVEITVLDY